MWTCGWTLKFTPKGSLSKKGPLFLFVEPYATSTRDSKKYIFRDLMNVSFEGKDLCEEASLNLQTFYTKNNFGLSIDLQSMACALWTAPTACSWKSSRVPKAWETWLDMSCELWLAVQHPGMASRIRAILYSAQRANMDPDNLPFNVFIVGPTNSGKMQFQVNKLCGPFCDRFDYVMLICLTFAYNKTPTASLRETCGCDLCSSFASSTKLSFGGKRPTSSSSKGVLVGSISHLFIW